MMKLSKRKSRLEIQSDVMYQLRASLIRAIIYGLASCAVGGLVTVYLGQYPARLHAAILALFTVIFALADSYYRSLLSELSALLRRGTYSAWQLQELNQTVPPLKSAIALVWGASNWLKGVVGLICALLIWDAFPSHYIPILLFVGYTCLVYSYIFAAWGRRNFRKLEGMVDALTLKEASLKEKNRLLRELQSGPAHDFDHDDLAKGYTSPGGSVKPS